MQRRLERFRRVAGDVGAFIERRAVAPTDDEHLISLVPRQPVNELEEGGATERHGGMEPDLGDPAAVRDLRGAGEKDQGAVTYGLENAAAQTTATSRPTNERAPDAEGDEPVGMGAAATSSNRRRPMTIAEKIFASRWVVDAANDRCGVPAVQPGNSGFVRTDWRFSHEYVSPMAAIFFEQSNGVFGPTTPTAPVLKNVAGIIPTILDGTPPAENIAQLQAALLVTGRSWIDYVSFSQGLPLYVIRVTPDPVWHDVLTQAARDFETNVTNVINEYQARTNGLPVMERRPDYEEITF